MNLVRSAGVLQKNDFSQQLRASPVGMFSFMEEVPVSSPFSARRLQGAEMQGAGLLFSPLSPCASTCLCPVTESVCIPRAPDALSRRAQSGKTKFTIENATKTRIVLADTRIQILGSFQNIRICRCAPLSAPPPLEAASGAPHAALKNFQVQADL